MSVFDLSLLPQILSQVSCFICVLSLDGRMLWLNRYAYGYNRSVEGTNADPIILEEDIPIWTEAFRQAVQGRREVRYTLRLHIPTRPGWVRVAGRLSGITIDGIVSYVVAITTDETEAGTDPCLNCASGCSPSQGTHRVEATPEHDGYVSLRQMAAIVHRERESLRHYPDLPAPAARGRRGQKALYLWSEVRPWLERRFNIHLPERFPGHKSAQR